MSQHIRVLSDTGFIHYVDPEAVATYCLIDNDPARWRFSTVGGQVIEVSPKDAKPLLNALGHDAPGRRTRGEAVADPDEKFAPSTEFPSPFCAASYGFIRIGCGSYAVGGGAADLVEWINRAFNREVAARVEDKILLRDQSAVYSRDIEWNKALDLPPCTTLFTPESAAGCINGRMHKVGDTVLNSCMTAAENGTTSEGIVVPESLSGKDWFPIYRQGRDHARKAIESLQFPDPRRMY